MDSEHKEKTDEDSNESSRHNGSSDHPVPSFLSEPSQSLSPPPGPSGFPLLSPPQSLGNNQQGSVEQCRGTDQNDREEPQEHAVQGSVVGENGSPVYSEELTERALRRIQKLRDRARGTPVVPGESSRSSEEGQAASLRAAKLLMELRLAAGVPSSSLCTHQHTSRATGNEAVVANESVVSVSEGQCAPEQEMTGCEEVPPAVVSPSPEESSEVAMEDESTTPVLKAAPPSWGADTDASSEFPGTQTTSSSSEKATPSSGSSCSVGDSQGAPQTLTQTLPLITSSPRKDDVITALPGLRHPYQLLRKQMSSETSSSTFTTQSSSSCGELEKIGRSARVCIQQSQEDSLEVPLAAQTLTPDMHDSVTPPDCVQMVSSSLQSEIETQPLDDDNLTDMHEELANEKPAWYADFQTEVQPTRKRAREDSSPKDMTPKKPRVERDQHNSSSESSGFKNPNNSILSSESSSQIPSTSSSSAPPSSSSSEPTPSSSSFYPPSLTSSNSSSGSSGDAHAAERSSNSQQKSSPNTSSNTSANKSVLSDTERASIDTTPCNVSATKTDCVVIQETPSQDEDDTVSYSSPILIDLTFQSQSLTSQEGLDTNSISLLSSSPEILQPLTKGIVKPRDIAVSPIRQTPAEKDVSDNRSDDERIDANGDDFCLQLNPSQQYVFQDKSLTHLQSSPVQSTATNIADTCSDSNLNEHATSSLNSVGIVDPGLTTRMEQGPLYDSLRELSGNNGSNTLPSQQESGSTGGSFKLNVPTESLIQPLTPPSQLTHSIQQSSQPFLPTVNNSTSTSVTPEQSVSHVPTSPRSIHSSVYSDSVVSNIRQSDTDSFALHIDTASDESSARVNSDTLREVSDQPCPTIEPSTNNVPESNIDETEDVLVSAHSEVIASPKTPRKSLSLKSRKKTPQKFVLAIDSQTGTSSQTSSISVPQLESSDSLDLPFSIQFPHNASLDVPMNTDTVTTPGNTSGHLFSSFKVRTAGKQPSSNKIVELVSSNNTNQRESQSQEGEVQFVRPRKQRNSPRFLFNSEEVHLIGRCDNITTRQTPEPTCTNSPSSSVFQDSALTSLSASTPTEVTPPEVTAAEVTSVSFQSQPIQPVPNLPSTIHVNHQALVTPTSSQPIPLSTSLLSPRSSVSPNVAGFSSFQSPMPSTPLQFTSPSTLMSPSGLAELKKQVGQEGVSRYELRHIRTIRTITEHRIVSSEIIENDRVLPESTRVWPETFEPREVQEVKLEVAPSYSTSFGFAALPQPVAMAHHLRSSVNMIASSSSLRESPLSLQPVTHNQEQRSVLSTPIITQRGSGPPVRRVYSVSSHDREHSASTSPCVSNQSTAGGSQSGMADFNSPIDSDSFVLSPSTPNEASRDTVNVPEAVPVTLGVGAKVIAKWRGKCWYVGTITERGKQGRIRVHYADGESGTVAESSIVSTDVLKEGVLVMAMPSLSPSQCADGLQPDTALTGIFVGWSDESQEMFQLRCGNEVHTFSSACLCVSSDTIKSCSNISSTPLSHKRKRSSAGKKRANVQPSGKNVQESLFRGLVFVLTQCPRANESMPASAIIVCKDTIAKHIKERGGKVEEVLLKKQVVNGRTFVLSDTFCRTKKYLFGLAMCLPCVSYTWINKCIELGRMLDYTEYRLPVGVNDSDGTVIQWSTSCCRSVLFRECAVYVIGLDSFKTYWSDITQACGAHVVSKLPTMTARSHSNLGRVIILAENAGVLSNSLKRQANVDSISVVRHSWAVQCLIQGQLLPVDGYTF